MKIVIPEGEHCNQCHFYTASDFEFRFCELHRRRVDADATGFTVKCWACKNKEPITIEYENENTK